MSEPFDPYRQWLSIPEDQWPPTHYQLLGIPADERDASVINAALLNRTAFVRKFQLGRYAEQAHQILNELSVAAVCLSDAKKRAAYDRSLQPVAPAPSTTPPARPMGIPPLAPPVQSPPVIPVPPPPLSGYQANSSWDPSPIWAAPVHQAPPQPATMFYGQSQPRARGIPPWLLASAVGGVVVILLLFAAIFSTTKSSVPLTDPLANDSTSSVTAADNSKSNDSVADQSTASGSNSNDTTTSESTVTADAAPPPINDRDIKVRDDNSLKMNLVWCPPGRFMMGSPSSDADAQFIERPQVAVELTHGFWLGKYELTQKEWEQTMGSTPWKGSAHFKEGPDYPATVISWSEAIEFCQTLTETERAAGRLGTTEEYRLPTAAEWEYACRAGTTTRYSFGDDVARLSEYAWWGGLNSQGSAKGELYSHKVGQKQSNPWGFCDMHGNVSEWCKDWFDDKLVGGRDPVSSDKYYGILVAHRGGNFLDGANECRSAYRGGFGPKDKQSHVGVRIAMATIVESQSPPDSDSMEPEFDPLSPSSNSPTLTIVGTEAGDEWDDNWLNMKFCWCPKGEFVMGAPSSDKDAAPWEHAQVDVTLTEGFWLAKYETTQRDWDSVMRTTPWKGVYNAKEGDDCAACLVHWAEAVKFCETFTASERKAGRLTAAEEFRLPNEKEWEYACRAGTTSRYSFGDDPDALDEYAWYAANTGNKGENYAHPVGAKRSNAWGLHDMHGNVWEWCRGTFIPTLSGDVAPSKKLARVPVGVHRGGSWRQSALKCRSYCRYDLQPEIRSVDIGFRVALVSSSK